MDGRDAIDYILKNNIPGDIVECGCGNGNFEIVWIQQLQKYNTLRHIHMYDTFAGLTEPSDKDYSVKESTQYDMTAEQVKSRWLSNAKSSSENNWCNWSVDYVKSVLSPFNYPNEYTHYIVGDIRKTLLDEKNIPEKIAILRLDTDWYDSSKIELEKLFPKVVPGGVIIFDDYNHWNGQRQATDEYFNEIGESYTMVKLNDKTVAMIKINPTKNNTSLYSLLNKYGSRDTRLGTDKATTHSYGETYEKLFHSKRNSKINMLEIGISGGFGLACYLEYFKQATITGIDIHNGIKADILNNERIQLIFGDAHDRNIITKLQPFDIIIEDASHTLHDQVALFIEYYYLIKPNGVYIIEDVDGNNLTKLTDILHPFASGKGFTLSIYDGREKNNRGDDILIILENTLV